MKRILPLLSVILMTQGALAGDHELSAAADNVSTAKAFLTSATSGDLASAEKMVHDDFSFVLMGRTQISNQVQDKHTYFTHWMPEVVGKLVPGGFRTFEIVDVIADEDSVALFAEGDAAGINGRYDNKYIFVCEFLDGKILSIAEYNSCSPSAEFGHSEALS